DVFRAVLVRAFRIGTGLPVSLESCVLLFERVGVVLQENETEDDVIVLGGIEVVTQLVCRLPQLLFEAQVRSRAIAPLCGRRCAYHVLDDVTLGFARYLLATRPLGRNFLGCPLRHAANPEACRAYRAKAEVDGALPS